MTEITDRPDTDADPYAIAATEEELRRELAAVYRLVAHYKMTDLIFTHISARLPTPPGAEPRFLINPYGLMFDEITASSLVVIDLHGNIVEPSPYTINPAGFVIHAAIHAARPDAHSVLHTHTKAGCAVAATEEGLLPINQINMEFYGRVSYHDYEGFAYNLAEQQRLVEDLGTNNALILRHHGLLTCAPSPLEAFGRMYYLDKACEIQVNAGAAGTVYAPPVEVCEYAAAQSRGEAPVDIPDGQGGKLLRAAFIRLVERIAPDYAD